jgi:nucleotide-binding universal stress UspA family protein
LHLVWRKDVFPTEILLATNGSPEAIVAEEAAVELASGTSSVLHVVFVVNTIPQLPYPHATARERSEALLEAKKLGGLRLLDNRVRRIRELGGDVVASYYREGSPDKEVARLGEELGVGLIVTGGCRRPWYERVFGPGFSERLLRRASRPVLVVADMSKLGQTVPK